MISDQRSYAAVSARLGALEEARVISREGNNVHFRDIVKAGVLSAPLRQWVPLLPLKARLNLTSWVEACIADERACFTTLFHGPSTTPLRRLLNHHGVVGQMLVKLLVRRYVITRQLLRELAVQMRIF